VAIAVDQDLGFSGSSTTTITVSGTFPAGALILVCVGFATANSGQSLSQTGNTFTTLFTRENVSTNNLVYYAGYISNWSGGALSTTFTLSSAGKDAGARLLSFTGVETTAPLLLSHDAGGAPKSTTMDSGVATGTTGPDDLLVGFFTWANTADISGTITEGTTPASGWNITTHSNGATGNTPHGHALYTWQILAGSAVTNPDASVTFSSPSAGVSYGATVAAFQAAATVTTATTSTLALMGVG
jgi:hypothetical protein